MSLNTAIALLCGVTILHSWHTLKGWIGFFSGEFHGLIVSVLFIMDIALGLMILPLVIKALRRQKKFDSLI